MECLWRSLAASISATLFSCHPSHAAHCFCLILSLFVWVCASLGKARWMKHCQWHLSMNTEESWLPSEMTTGALQAVPGPVGGLQPWFEAEPRAVPGASPAGSLGCRPQHARGLFLSSRLLEPAGSRAEQASHRHPGLVPQRESGQHVAASTCAHQPAWALPGKPSPQPRSYLPYPCAMDVDFLADIFLCSIGSGGAQGRALGALGPQGHWGKAKA